MAYAHYIRRYVLFHNDRKSAEIIQQIVGFGVEKHDDLVDAVSMGLNYIQSNVRWQILAEYGGFRFSDDPTGTNHGEFTVTGVKYLDELD